MSISSNKDLWPSVAPYVVPPVAAGLGIVPVWRDMVAKSAQQLGRPASPMSFVAGMRAGIVEGTPSVGLVVGSQMIVQSVVEKALANRSNLGEIPRTLASAAITGIASSPFIAIFNGKTMGWSFMKSLRNFTPLQALAISVQESAFVGGLSVAENLGASMQRALGDNQVVDYSAAFVSGALGGLAGHPANTALTRWQKGLPVENIRQLMWGATRRTWAVGILSVLYKFNKGLITPKPEH